MATWLNIIERHRRSASVELSARAAARAVDQITLEAALTGTFAGVIGGRIGLLAVIVTSLASGHPRFNPA